MECSVLNALEDLCHSNCLRSLNTCIPVYFVGSLASQGFRNLYDQSIQKLTHSIIWSVGLLITVISSLHSETSAGTKTKPPNLKDGGYDNVLPGQGYRLLKVGGRWVIIDCNDD
jgi:hypothetical protein